MTVGVPSSGFCFNLSGEGCEGGWRRQGPGPLMTTKASALQEGAVHVLVVVFLIHLILRVPHTRAGHELFWHLRSPADLFKLALLRSFWVL